MSQVGDVTLVDVWLVIRRRWLFVAGGLLIGVTAGLVHILASETLYQSHAVVQVGGVTRESVTPGSGFQRLEETREIATRLLGRYGRQSINHAGSSAYLQAAKEGEIGLELVVLGRRPELAQKLLERIVSELLREHQELLETTTEPLDGRILVLNEHIRSLRGRLEELDVLTRQLREQRPAEATLAAVEAARLHEVLSALERERLNTSRLLTSPFSRRSRVLSGPSQAEAPVAPNKQLALAVGLALGAIGGVFLALVREFLTRIRVAANES
jgi:hypothetical protein